MTFIWRFYHLKVQNNMSQIILPSQPLSGRPLELFLYISRGGNHGCCDIHSACVKASWGLYRSECHHCLPLRGEIRQSIGTAYCYCICRNAQYKVHLYSNYYSNYHIIILSYMPILKHVSEITEIIVFRKKLLKFLQDVSQFLNNYWSRQRSWDDCIDSVT